MVCLVNEYRQNSGRSTLTVDSRLTAAARAHSEDMVARNFFDHVTPDGVDPFERMVAAGYPVERRRWGEHRRGDRARHAEVPVRRLPGQSAAQRRTCSAATGAAIGVGFATPAATLGNTGATVTQTFGSAYGQTAAPEATPAPVS